MYFTDEIDLYSRRQRTCDDICMDKKLQQKICLRPQTCGQIQGPISQAEKCPEALSLQSSQGTAMTIPFLFPS